MTNMHPLDTTRHLDAAYKQYLRSLLVMNDPALNALYAEQLDQEILVKGPYLEGTLPFASSGSIASLVAEGVLSDRFLRVNQDVLPAKRPIYAHQERAIRKVVSESRNLVVATGTGSGKTESFLIPLLNTLFQEPAEKRKSAGVRALLLYPMNALANDQLKRLRALLKFNPEISFGRFTGETENTEAKAREQFRRENDGESPLQNERLSRESMRQSPPDILITNYAMLEYLLLRPEDTVFFDAPYNTHWSTIVLDEVHTYNGALGVEISMLLRRVKQRINAKPGQLRCIGTSATIGSLDERPDVARFAETLFGESFEWEDADSARQDVVTGERVVIAETAWGHGTPALYEALYEGLQRIRAHEEDKTVIREVGASIGSLIPTYDADLQQSAATYGAFLYGILIGDARTRQTQELLRQKAFDVATFAELISLDHADDGEVVVRFIELLLHAKRTANEKPLLPSRYHVFIKALEGMFVCLNRQGHTDGNRRVYLKRREVCPECNKRVYELSRCTRCGAPYISGSFTPDRGIQLIDINDYTQPEYLLLDNDIGETDQDDVAETPSLNVQSYRLCTSCGIPRSVTATGEVSVECVCGSSHAVTLHRRIYPPRNDEAPVNAASYCVNCGASGGGTNILMSAETGKDAPVGILASELYQHIPGNGLGERRGDGRRMIVFADGRQDAAFFAPYLERNYGTALHRRLILEELTRLDATAPGEVRLDDVVQRIRQRADEIVLYEDNVSSIQKNVIVRRWITREMIAVNRELTLETQGLLEIRLTRPARFVTPPRLNDLGLTTDEAWNFVQLLFRSLRQRRAMSFPEGVSPADDDFMPGPTQPFCVRKNRSAKHIYAWLPADGVTNMRLEMTLNLLRALKGSSATRDDALAVLGEIWDIATAPSGPMRGYLQSMTVPQEGVVFQLDYAMHELVPAKAPTGYQCNKCRTHAYVHVRHVCTVKKCTGSMQPIHPDGDALNLYQRQYLRLIKTGMSVQEHSANLSSEDARDIQIKFTNGDINVLSCTTTFELGVDVGELQTVFLRNMPPSTANYIQRAGRAGRRDGSTAMIVTFCQRRSHDLTYFDNPIAMISGVIPAPRLQTDNTKITRRHVYAMVLSAFLRHWSARNDNEWPRTSGKFFRRADTRSETVSPVVQRLVDFLQDHPQAMLAELQTVLTPQMRAELGIENWSWLGAFTQEESVQSYNKPEYLNSLWRAEHQLNEEFASVQIPMAEIMAKGVNATSAEMAQIGRLTRMLKTLEDRQLFGVLPNYGLMPKYGFPTDVVQLKTDHIANEKASKIELTRDLRIAIGEYSPGSQIVAAGRVWESGGIVIPGGRGLVSGKYMRCSACEYVTVAIGDVPANCCQNCGAVGNTRDTNEYIMPEFGFIARADSGKPLVGGRPPRGFAARLAFSGETMAAQPMPTTDPLLVRQNMDVFFNRNVKLTAINEGHNHSGFSFCERCGYATNKTRERDHKSPLTDRPCNGHLQRRKSLLHTFVTDVLEIQLNRVTGKTKDWRGVLYAVLEAASTMLQIERDEIDGTVYLANNAAIRLVIFDTVPGGAGFALQIAERVSDVLRGALRHVDTECCGPETSCYRCLRTYSNEWFHATLKRGAAVDQLRMLLGE